MKLLKVLVLFSAIVFLNLNLIAQDDRIDDFSFDQEPLQTESTPYFALGGGITINFNFLNYDEVNKALNTFMPGKSFDGNLTQIGGEGFTGLIYLNNVRATFFSYGGSKSESMTLSIDNNNYTKKFNYSTSMWGASFDYAIVPTKKLAILPGIAIGRSTINMDAFQSQSNFNWSDYKPDFNNSNIYRHQIEGSYWNLKPQVNIEYALASFMMVRLGVGYNIGFGYDWKYNNEANVNNIPDKLNANGLNVQTGIFFGLFNY
ncbi:MAG TPA: hypothetical protein PLE30_04595 [Candidatus Kapabacteria bacterium]|nr:hypothetical protein [Candidatus Kapabacteria bacterium]